MSKLRFDHHKGMFGVVAMLKAIADHYPYASIESFENVKVLFLNATGMYYAYVFRDEKANFLYIDRQTFAPLEPFVQEKWHI